MHYLKTSIILFSLVATSGALMAQEEAPSTFTYATYFYCDANGQDQVDEIIKTKNAPVFDQLVKDGVISSWGWMAHHTGGKWRRVQYYQAPSIDGLLDAQAEMDKRFDAVPDNGDEEFGNICSSHDDYIWKVESGTGSDTRSDAGFSVYYVCNEVREERADEIWAKDFAPILNKAVADGKLSSWGWQSHQVGGKYRRIQTMTAPTHKALLAARGELIEAMYGDDNAAGKEFTEICGSHADYMWNIQIETP